MAIQKSNKVTTATNNKKRQRKVKEEKVDQPSQQPEEEKEEKEEKVTQQPIETPAWNDDDDNDNEYSVKEEEGENQEDAANSDSGSDSGSDADSDSGSDADSDKEVEQDNEDDSQESKESANKKIKVQHNNNEGVWIDDEDGTNKTFKTKSLLTVVPEWAKVKEKTEKDEEEEEINKIINSNKSVYSGDSIKFIVDKFQQVLPGQLTSIVYNTEGNLIFMGDIKGNFRVFQGSVEFTKKFKPLYQGKFVDFSIENLYFIQSTNEVIITGLDKEYYYTFEVLSEKITKRPLRVGKNYLKKSSISNSYFAISDSTCRVSIISLLSKTVINEFRIPSNGISAMSFSTESSKKLFIASEGFIFVFCLEKMAIVNKFKDFGNFGSNSITCISCSPDGNYLVTGSESGIVNSYRYQDCFESTTPKPLKTIESIVHPITSLQFSSSSSLLLASSKYSNKATKLIQYPTHQVNQSFQFPIKTSAAAFSPNNQRLIIGEEFGSLSFFKLKYNSKPSKYSRFMNKSTVVKSK